MTKPIFKRPLQHKMGEVHFHVRDKKRTYAWSYSEERAQARAREDNLKLRAAGYDPMARVFRCQAINCFAITGKERD